MVDYSERGDMEMLKLNEIPVRTSKNFDINNIELEEHNILNNIEQFKNITITEENCKIENNTSNIELVYGLGKIFTNQVKMQANQKLKLTIDNKQYKENQIEFKFDSNNVNLVEDIEIIANQNSESTVIIKYLSDENVQAYHNGILRVNAKKNSKIDIIIFNMMNIKSNNFIAIQNIGEEDSKVNFIIIDFGGNKSVTNYYSNLIGEKSNNTINTIYLGKENQIFDLNYIVELKGEKSNTNIEVQGALKDVAKKHFKGTIDFKKGCKKSTGNENESCMLLSDTARSISLPMLLCSEEEVEGNHSNSAGKIGEKELFYIMSRGFEIKDAMKLMVKAKFNKILENIKDEELKEQILNEIDNRLS